MFGVYLFCRILNYIILLEKYCFQINHMHTFVTNTLLYFLQIEIQSPLKDL